MIIIEPWIGHAFHQRKLNLKCVYITWIYLLEESLYESRFRAITSIYNNPLDR